MMTKANPTKPSRAGKVRNCVIQNRENFVQGSVHIVLDCFSNVVDIVLKTGHICKLIGYLCVPSTM